jgi:murein DD-endopeptidase MepM/ murein hydrolase activator NlpD
LAGLVLPASASAHSASGETGGAGVPDDPTIAAAVCENATAWECARGAKLTIEGEALDDVKQVRFLGGRGPRDDRVARPQVVDEHRLDVRVPRGARSGRIALTSRSGAKATAPRPLRVRARMASARNRAAVLPVAPGAGVFPVQGTYEIGKEFVQSFGGGRGHEGHDVFADCGTPLVALYDTTVQHVATQSAAGNYVVLQGADGASYAYMHMQSKATVAKGDVVKAGTPVGRVGDTGRASGCHLHFEQWTAPGWYEGGDPVDPLPLLRSLGG